MTINSPKHGIFKVLIDTEDVEKVSKYNWCIRIDKWGLYAVVYIRREHKLLYLDKYIMDADKTQMIYHHNGNKLDNRKSNIVVTKSSLSYRLFAKEMGYKNIYYRQSIKKWVGEITINNERKTICQGDNANIIYLKVLMYAKRNNIQLD